MSVRAWEFSYLAWCVIGPPLLILSVIFVNL